MAQISYDKSKGKVSQGNEIKSIVGKNYLNDFESRKQTKREMAQKDHEALIKAEKIVLLSKTEQGDNS